jgi:hypothetical protein
VSRLVEEDQWVWVVVQDPERDAQFLGQYDEGKDLSFVPFFLEKEEAQAGMKHLIRDEGRQYEIQAIRYDDLRERTQESGFMLFQDSVLNVLRP